MLEVWQSNFLKILWFGIFLWIIYWRFLVMTTLDHAKVIDTSVAVVTSDKLDIIQLITNFIIHSTLDERNNAMSLFENMNKKVNLIDTSTIDLNKLKISYNHTILAPVNHVNDTVISYAIYSPVNSNDPVHLQCLSNLDFFIDHGIVNNNKILYIFHLIGKTIAPIKLTSIKRKYRNIQIITHKSLPVDLFAHGNIIKKYLNNKELFLFLNCGVRGPYYKHSKIIKSIKTETNTNIIPINKLESTLLWLDIFTSKLQGNTKAVGSTISCEIMPHIQTFTLLLTKETAQIALNYWTMNKYIANMTKLEIIYYAEVELSKGFLDAGYNIASLDSKHLNYNFLKYNHSYNYNNSYNNINTNFICDMNYPNDTSYYVNPVSCRKDKNHHNRPTYGCLGTEPCENVFIKNGGDLVKLKVLPKQTITNIINTEKSLNDINPSICNNDILPRKQNYQLNLLFNEILLYNNINNNINNHNIKYFSQIDNNSTVVIIIRTHFAYYKQLLAMLWTLNSITNNIKNHSLRVIILPTEPNIMYKLIKLIDKSFPIELRNNIYITPIDIPNHIYSNNDYILNTLCNNNYIYKVLLSGKFTPYDMSRYCWINSSIHYLLVDIIIYYITNYCINCMKLIITNSDNFYSPKFFDLIIHHFNYDIVMTNMITRGKLLYVQPKPEHVDLGAYIINVNFLKNNSINFLNSLPMRPEPKDYHDADGHFIVNMKNNNANIKIIDDFLFYHN